MAEVTCTGCKPEHKTEKVLIPLIAHESEMTRNERDKKRLWVLVIISWIAVILIVGIFTYERLQYDYESEIIICTQDGEGTNIIGDENEVDNGTETIYKE